MRPKNVIGQVLFIGISAAAFIVSPTFAQDAEQPRFRSRSELTAARQQIEKNFPQEIRALRALHLPPDKAREAEMKLQRVAAVTRSAREELQNLEQLEGRQGYNLRSSSERVHELRTKLQQAREQLQAELKTLFTPQQREQFERRLQKERPKPAADRRNSR